MKIECNESHPHTGEQLASVIKEWKYLLNFIVKCSFLIPPKQMKVQLGHPGDFLPLQIVHFTTDHFEMLQHNN